MTSPGHTSGSDDETTGNNKGTPIPLNRDAGTSTVFPSSITNPTGHFGFFGGGSSQESNPTTMPTTMKPKIFQYLRKYDGTTDSKEYIERLETDIDLYNIPHKWLIQNLDRILEHQALSWYNSVYPEIQALITTTPPLNLWHSFKGEFLKFFNRKGLLHAYKQANRAILFSPGSDPQEYVTKKLEALRHIDPQMSESRRVDNLIKGLPIQLQIHFAASSPQSATDFLSQLRKLEEIQNRKRESQYKQRDSHNNYPHQSAPSYQQSHFLAAFQGRPNNNRFPQSFNPRPTTVTCNYCHYPGHIIRDCRNKVMDESNNIYQRERNFRPNLEEHKRRLNERRYNNGYDARRNSPRAFPRSNNARFRNNYEGRPNNNSNPAHLRSLTHETFNHSENLDA